MGVSLEKLVKGVRATDVVSEQRIYTIGVSEHSTSRGFSNYDYSGESDL